MCVLPGTPAMGVLRGLPFALGLERAAEESILLFLQWALLCLSLLCIH